MHGIACIIYSSVRRCKSYTSQCGKFSSESEYHSSEAPKLASKMPIFIVGPFAIWVKIEAAADLFRSYCFPFFVAKFRCCKPSPLLAVYSQCLFVPMFEEDRIQPSSYYRNGNLLTMCTS